MVRPANPAEGRQWNFFNGLDWIRPIVFPEHIQRLLLKSRLNNNEGYQFYVFMVGNGLNPPHAGQILVDRYAYDSYQRGKLVQKTFDGTLQGRYYDIHLRHVTNL